MKIQIHIFLKMQSTSPSKTEISKNLHDFSHSLANLANLRTKTSLLTTFESENDNIQTKRGVLHRRTSSNTTYFSTNMHKRQYSNNSLEILTKKTQFSNEFDIKPDNIKLLEDLKEISNEISKRDKNYKEISVFLDKHADELLSNEKEESNERYKDIRNSKILYENTKKQCFNEENLEKGPIKRSIIIMEGGGISRSGGNNVIYI